jgi:hypothetical protein
MAQPYELALIQITTVLAAVSGVNQAPERPNETQNDYPFVVTYLVSGELGAGATGTRKSLYNIAIDLLTNRMDLNRDLQILNPFIDTIPAALIAEVSVGGDKFSSTISTFDTISMTFLPAVDYAGVQMIGYRFMLNNVKILNNT